MSIKVLIEFDAIFDTEVGFIRYLRTNYPDLVNEEFASQSIVNLLSYKWKDPTFLSKAFKDKYDPESVYRIYKESMKEDFYKIAIKSPLVPSIERMIVVANDQNLRNMIKTELLASNSEEAAILKKVFPTLSVIDLSEHKKLDFNQWSRIFIANIDEVYKYRGLMFKHLAVLNYPRNFEVINGVKVLKRQAVASFGITNQFEIIDPNV